LEVENDGREAELVLRIEIPETWVRQFSRDAYDSGYECQLRGIYIKNLGGSPDARIEASATGTRDHLERWRLHLTDRWGPRRRAVEHEDKHKTDQQWVSVSVAMKAGPVYVTPLHVSLGPHMLSFAVLAVGFEYGKTKPKSLLGAMIWNGNHKWMWSISLTYLTLEYLRIGRGKGDYHLF